MFNVFKRKQTPMFVDWAIANTIVSELRSPQIDIDYAFHIVSYSMRLGMGLGAQFPAKVLPIIRQLVGSDAEKGYEEMRVKLEQHVGSIAESGTFDSLPLIADWRKGIKPQGAKSLTNELTANLAARGLLYGLCVGKSHSELSLRFLESSIQAENMLVEIQMELHRDSWPADLRNVHNSSYTEFLQDMRKMVEEYEAEYGPLA